SEPAPCRCGCAKPDGTDCGPEGTAGDAAVRTVRGSPGDKEPEITNSVPRSDGAIRCARRAGGFVWRAERGRSGTGTRPHCREDKICGTAAGSHRRTARIAEREPVV